MKRGKLEEILKLHSLWIDANPRGRIANLMGEDLTGVDLRGMDLSGAILRKADLRGADLERANLMGATFELANLKGADLRGADLTRVDFWGADLRGADLREADLYRADFRSSKDFMGEILTTIDANIFLAKNLEKTYNFKYASPDKEIEAYFKLYIGLQIK